MGRGLTWDSWPSRHASLPALNSNQPVCLYLYLRLYFIKRGICQIFYTGKIPDFSNFARKTRKIWFFVYKKLRMEEVFTHIFEQIVNFILNYKLTSEYSWKPTTSVRVYVCLHLEVSHVPIFLHLCFRLIVAHAMVMIFLMKKLDLRKKQNANIK